MERNRYDGRRPCVLRHDGGWFRAADARTGKTLWQFKTPSGIIGQPITYRGPDGKQYVAILSGIGGWPGGIVSANLDVRDDTAGNGSGGAMLVAEPKDEFALWFTNQAQSSVQPATPEATRGQQVFMTHACVLCHSIRGTSAGSRVGPDLTHLASRATIAAGTLANTAGNLGGWILNPQSIKPGCRLPPNQLSRTDLQDLLAHLETLQ